MEDLLFEGIFIAVGLMMQLVARATPFRAQQAAPEVRWDIIAMLFGTACGLLYGITIDDPMYDWAVADPTLQSWQTWVASWPWPVILVANFLVSDFLVYWAHRLMHSRVLWHAHAWHHSSKHVWWLSGLRATPLHAALVILPHTVGFLLFPLGEGGAVLTGVILFRFANQHWLHSNLKLPYARQLERVFITPRVHFVHHSADVRFTNSNYAFVFTFWDRMFGTYTDPDKVPLDEPLGLDYENSYARFMIGLPPPAHPRAEQASAALRPASPRAAGLES